MPFPTPHPNAGQPARNRFWTPARVAVLRKHAGQCHRFAKYAARELGCTPKAARDAKHRYIDGRRA